MESPGSFEMFDTMFHKESGVSFINAGKFNGKF